MLQLLCCDHILTAQQVIITALQRNVEICMNTVNTYVGIHNTAWYLITKYYFSDDDMCSVGDNFFAGSCISVNL